MHPLRAALSGLVDYAGLFPPAALDLDRTLANHERYVSSPESWMLGRLVVPAAGLGAVHERLSGRSPAGPSPWWTITVLAPAPPGTLAEAVGAIDAFNRAYAPRVAVVAIESAAASGADVTRFAADVPDWLERYVEITPDERCDRVLDAAMHAGCYAKVRAGGVTSDRFPSPEALARFIAGCAEREVPMKATAGLHHPLRGVYPLTYAPDSPTASMVGFVNLVMAATLAAAGPADVGLLARVLADDDVRAWAFEEDRIRWRDVTVTRVEAADARARLLRSVGSCSFEEPVSDLRRLGWWPPD